MDKITGCNMIILISEALEKFTSFRYSPVQLVYSCNRVLGFKKGAAIYILV